MNAVQMPLALNISHLFGAPPITSHIEAFLGLTDWKRSGDDPPEFLGWYRTREGDGRTVVRRYFNGRLWSLPVTRHMSDEVANIKGCFFVSADESDQVIWCGLRKPHLVGYFDPLTTSDRTQRIRQSKE